MGRRGPDDLSGRQGFCFESLDLREFERVAPVVDRLLAGVDRLDLVVLSAGVLGRLGDLRDSPLADLKNTTDVNLWVNQALLDRLFAGGRAVSQVVAVSSGASVDGHRGWGGYSLSEAALDTLVRLYAAERPGTHYDPRALAEEKPVRSSLHAKCVVVDAERVFVSSANFTEAAQQRNIEVGLSIQSAWLAGRLLRHFRLLQGLHEASGGRPAEGNL